MLGGVFTEDDDKKLWEETYVRNMKYAAARLQEVLMNSKLFISSAVPENTPMPTGGFSPWISTGISNLAS